MVDTALSGLLWAQANLPAPAYVDAIWAARYPDFAGGNEPKARGIWPFDRAQPASALSFVKWPDQKVTNVAAFKPVGTEADQGRIAGALAQIAEQVRRQAKAP
jgi:hypothetical protein